MFRSLITGTAVVAATGIALVGEDPVVETMVVGGFGVVVLVATGRLSSLAPAPFRRRAHA